MYVNVNSKYSLKQRECQIPYETQRLLNSVWNIGMKKNKNLKICKFKCKCECNCLWYRDIDCEGVKFPMKHRN